MKKMVCELCECNQFVKDNGMFVCQGCGTKYTLAEAKALMQEAGEDFVPASAAAPAEQPKRSENLLALAEGALMSGNFGQAGEYADKILENEGFCGQAWMIKAAAVSGQNSIKQPRINEVMSCWAIALKHTPETEQEACRQQIRQQAERMLRAMAEEAGQQFKLRPNRIERDRVIQMCASLRSFGPELQEKLQVQVDMPAILAYTAEVVNSAAVAASNTADNNFGTDPSQRTKAAWDRWLSESDNCAMLLSQVMPMAATDALIRQMHENYKIIIGNTINSCSLKRDYYGNYVKDYSLSLDATYARKKMITENINQMNRCIAALNERAQAEKEKEEALRRERIEAYWQARPEMKAQMDAKQQELEAQLENNRLELEAIKARQTEISGQLRRLDKERSEPVKAQVVQNEIIKEISDIQRQWQSLGMFKGKEKKELEEQYETKKKYRDALKPLIADQVAQQEAQIREKQAPLQEQAKLLHTKAEELKASSRDIAEKLEKLQAFREKID